MAANNAPVRSIEPKELKQRIEAGEDLVLIDVREPHEREICNIGGELIPKDTVMQHLERIPRDKDVVVYCRSGGRSGWVAQELHTKCGYTNLINLAGGMLRWADDVDPTMTKY